MREETGCWIIINRGRRFWKERLEKALRHTVLGVVGYEFLFLFFLEPHERKFLGDLLWFFLRKWVRKFIADTSPLLSILYGMGVWRCFAFFFFALHLLIST
jgi:hypothetical protein